MEEEIWKDVVGYEGYYKISSFGNLMSCDRKVQSKNNSYALKKGKIKKCAITNCYKLAMLSKYNSEKGFSVHRLVAIAFIPNPKNKPEVNHKDGNKLNNHFLNLEWCTRSENAIHSYANNLQVGRAGSLHHFAKINESDIIEIIRFHKSGISKNDIGIKFNLSIGSIRRIVNRTTWRHVKIPSGLATDKRTLK